ncbi:DUF1876 domain-containing protein [Haloechinothrix halophila]|uniref:DUF1876 domain-containing protein n=1 Tax=Haloechinothrix halophila TaxID=1069073 RepID=UPI0003FDF6F8|nr:DUF1876 domain-containing protein [Haloechinothrix halophila]
MHEKHWTVEITIDEHESRTRARARLHASGTDNLVGVGLARLNPEDVNVPKIGDELAASRALSDLAHRLLDVTADDIESVTHEPAHLRL